MIKVLNKNVDKKIYRERCDCGAELEFSFDDTCEGYAGLHYIKCPVCGKEIFSSEIDAENLDSSNIEFPRHFDSLCNGVDIDDETIQKWIRKCLKIAEESDEPYGYFVQAGSGNTQVILMAYEDEYNIVVAKNYYETTVSRD